MTDPLLFTLAIATLLATPGPTNTLLATAGTSGPPRSAVGLLAAELAGYLCAVMLARLALGPLITAQPVAETALKLGVAAWLVVVAVRLWQKGGPQPGDARSRVSPGTIFFTTLVNPKALILAFGVLPFDHAALPVYLASFCLMVPSAGALWFFGGAALRRNVPFAAERVVPRVAAVALTAFAGLIGASAL
jgi:threonine/homoserine/homoserine lactone efflux protein